MIAFFRPQPLFVGTAIQKQTDTEQKQAGIKVLPNKNRANDNSSHAVVSFAHHRDVKVALDELRCAGFSSDCLILIGRNVKRLNYSELIIKSCFEAKQFSFNQIAQKMFLKLFNRGKYLVLINGSRHDVNAASKIVSRRPKHAQVWYFE